MMRSVCFVDRLELEFSGNHFSHAITVGDVDNDGLNELLVGNVDGVLAVFKGDTDNKPWKKCSGLGTVTCVGVGDVFNSGTNSVVTINAEAQCNIFIINSNMDSKSPPLSRLPSTSSSSSTSSPSEQLRSPVTTPSTPPINSKSMKPIHTQPLEVPNAKVICFARLVPEGGWDMCVGHTDRGMAVYRWNDEIRKLELVQKFSLPGQIGSLSVGQSSGGTPQLLISQPGGTYVPLFYRQEETEPKDTGRSEIKFTYTDRQPDFCIGEVIGTAQRRNPTSPSEVVGEIRGQPNSSADEGICDDEVQSSTVALCTLDGIVRLLKDDEKQWELQVDHSLFAIGKLDVTGNGSDEIVVCAWDGTTYIVDHNRNCVRFWFDQNVSAFCCGYYGVSDGRNVPCLVYTTFSKCIYLYRDITLPAVPSSNLLLTLQNMSLPSKLQEKLNSMDSGEKQTFLRKCLYEYELQERTDTLEQPETV